jgi:hypothetical protein
MLTGVPDLDGSASLDGGARGTAREEVGELGGMVVHVASGP